MNTQVIILAAGKGTRMGSDIPKVLVNLQGQALILRLLANLEEFGTKESLVVVVGHKSDQVQTLLGPQFTYAVQPDQLGTAHAVLAAKDKISGKNVVVLYGDMPFTRAESLRKLIEAHEKKQSKLSLFTVTVPNFNDQFETFSNYGRIIRGTNQNLLKISEVKDATTDEQSILEVNPGVYVFDTEWLWQNIEKVSQNTHGEYYLTDLIEIAIKQGVGITTIPIDPMEVYGINTPKQLEQAEKLLV